MNYYKPYITLMAKKYGVDPELALAVAEAESGFSPKAKSPAGAIGIFQLMPGTAKSLGVDPYDPAQNIEGGIKYLKQQLDTFGSVPLALAAYNAGPGAVKKYGSVPPYREVQSYVNKVMSRVKNLPVAKPSPQVVSQPQQDISEKIREIQSIGERTRQKILERAAKRRQAETPSLSEAPAPKEPQQQPKESWWQRLDRRLGGVLPFGGTSFFKKLHEKVAPYQLDPSKPEDLAEIQRRLKTPEPKTEVGKVLRRGAEIAVDTMFFTPREAYGVEKTETGTKAGEVASEILGMTGMVAPFSGAQSAAGLATRLAGRLAPAAARAMERLPQLVRTAGRGAGAGAAYWGMEQAALPEGYKPGLKGLPATMATFGAGEAGAGLAGEALRRVLPKTPAAVEHAARGAGFGIGGAAGQLPFAPPEQRPTVGQTAEEAAKLAAFGAMMSLLGGRAALKPMAEELPEAPEATPGEWQPAIKAPEARPVRLRRPLEAAPEKPQRVAAAKEQQKKPKLFTLNNLSKDTAAALRGVAETMPSDKAKSYIRNFLVENYNVTPTRALALAENLLVKKEVKPAMVPKTEVKPPVETAAKEPWQMMQEEWIEQARRNTDEGLRGMVDTIEFQSQIKNAHREKVKQALAEGKPVPPEVLKDYPDLAVKTEAKPFGKTKEEAKKIPQFSPSDRITWKNTMGETLTGTVQEITAGGKLKVETEAPTKQILIVGPENPTLRKAPKATEEIKPATETEPTKIEREKISTLEKEKSVVKAAEARRQEILDTKVNFGEKYGVMTRGEFLRARLSEGARVEAVKRKDRNATEKAEKELKELKQRYIPGLSNPNTPTAKRYHELEKRLQEGIY
ncbi:MAG: transglycosylase SLT domain-containing protein, partial [Deltaproteobacteria bacterium]|nr:transglycosylase SLT domain-containing protein [Deltaproteobacteria bacterium]